MSDLTAPLASPVPPPLPDTGRSAGYVLLLWLVILASVGYTVLEHFLSPPSTTAAADESAHPGNNLSPELQISARYAVGLSSLNTTTASAMGPVIARLNDLATTPVEQLRLMMVLAELQGETSVIPRLGKLTPTFEDADLQRDADDLLRLFGQQQPPLAGYEEQRLVNRHGWFAKVALAAHAGPGTSEYAAAIEPARHTLKVMGGFFAAFILFFIGGFVLFILAIVWLALGKVRLAYPRPIGDVTLLLEAFAIYVASMAVVGAVFQHWVGVGGALELAIRILALFVTSLVPIVWPLLRGMRGSEWRRLVGWHVGRGVFTEIGAGLLGYIAGLPIIVVGILITLLLTNLTNAHASHPITRLVGRDLGHTLELFILASVLAPFLEETLFRGALFGYLRGRWGWTVSTIIVSTIFASLHPQGWVALPALFAIALILAAIREWRGSILPSMAAHALNNTVLLLLLTISLS